MYLCIYAYIDVGQRLGRRLDAVLLLEEVEEEGGGGSRAIDPGIIIFGIPWFIIIVIDKY